MVSYGVGEPPHPLFKLGESENFEDMYRMFLKESQTKPCVIILEKHHKENQ
tara:strand:+ start:211 stop:363 length:153 start_codon:yes stop_codon:yes gene_type:complete